MNWAKGGVLLVMVTCLAVNEMGGITDRTLLLLVTNDYVKDKIFSFFGYLVL